MKKAFVIFLDTRALVILSVFGLLLGLPAPALAGAGPVFSSKDADILLDPRSEPPCLIVEFEAAGSLDNEWVGHFVDPATGAVGTLEVETRSSTWLGDMLYLEQLWTLQPPDPVVPPDPCFPPDPAIPVELEGSLNPADGTLVLDGTTESGGLQVHVRGQVVFGESGAISASGELMFNPQPEPPGWD